MSRNKGNNEQSGDFDRARDELFQFIHRCGVLRATEEHQIQWMDETVEYMAECYPALGRERVEELRNMGLRFCRPVIHNVTTDDETMVEGVASTEEASAAAA